MHSKKVSAQQKGLGALLTPFLLLAAAQVGKQEVEEFLTHKPNTSSTRKFEVAQF